MKYSYAEKWWFSTSDFVHIILPYSTEASNQSIKSLLLY